MAIMFRAMFRREEDIANFLGQIGGEAASSAYLQIKAGYANHTAAAVAKEVAVAGQAIPKLEERASVAHCKSFRQRSPLCQTMQCPCGQRQTRTPYIGGRSTKCRSSLKAMRHRSLRMLNAPTFTHFRARHTKARYHSHVHRTGPFTTRSAAAPRLAPQPQPKPRRPQ